MTQAHNNAYQSYLEARHAAFATPRPLVDAMVRRATSQPATSLARLVRGNDNEVYIARLPQGEDVVVRIHRSGSCSLAEEAWPLGMARSVGVPVPEVLLVDQVVDGETALEFMVETRVPGQPLEDRLPRLTQAERRHVFRQMGEVLARLHSIRVGGFYRRQPDGTWDFPDWSALMASAVRERAAERPWLRAAGFGDDEISCMVELIERYRREFTCAEPVLCHGDFIPAHVFVDDDLHISGVIDFGEYQGNHPIQDLATLSMMTGSRIEEGVRRGYMGAALLDDRFALRLRLHRLMLEVGYLAHHLQIPGHPAAPLYARGLRRTLRWLRAYG